MATRIETGRRFGGVVDDWTAGVLAGLVAGVLGGAFVQLVSPSVLAEAIPAMYGLDGAALAAGWTLHLLHSVLFGLGYAALVGTTGAVERVESVAAATGLGVTYGVALWVLIAVTFVPLAMPALGYAAAPGFPYLSPLALIAYVGFGAVLGAVHALVR